jgi:hypothetical protein
MPGVGAMITTIITMSPVARPAAATRLGVA